jgi:aminoglycoside phosphotransferase (APT) family kinase protein
LLGDAGAPLREVRRGVEEVNAFGALLPRFAQMQITSLSSVPHLLQMGLPDRRLQRLPDLLQSLLSVEASVVGRDVEAWDSLREEARQSLPRLRQICDEMSASEVAAALDHGDLHQGNVLVQGDEICLGDWGDACITHPFCSMLLTLETALSNIAPEKKETWATVLCNAYLKPWQALRPREALQRDFERAMWVAHVVRALNFAHMFQGADEVMLARWRPMIAERLEMWVSQDTPPP